MGSATAANSCEYIESSTVVGRPPLRHVWETPRASEVRVGYTVSMTDASMCGLWDIGSVDRVIEAALVEDLHSGDITARATVGSSLEGRARIVAKQPLVVCGTQVVKRVFTAVDSRIAVDVRVADGERVDNGTEVIAVAGPARSLLAGERTALNLLQRMSGVATQTRSYVDAIAGRCRVVDTRKTMPGLRALDRYAVRCGGGHNHRNDLGSGVLIKENHIVCAGGITAAITRARAVVPHTLAIECEVQTLDELREALAAGADIVMLDNMSDDEIREAVSITEHKALLEVSGGVDLARATEVANLGIDLISVGRLTHSVPACDLSMLFVAGGLA